MAKVFRYYVEKFTGFDASAKAIEADLREALGISGINIRLFYRYDIQGIAANQTDNILNTVLRGGIGVLAYEEQLPDFPQPTELLYVEPVEGQFDSRADNCAQSIQLLLGGERPIVKTAIVYAFANISDKDYKQITSYLINPLEYRTASTDKPASLIEDDYKALEDIPEVDLSGSTAEGLGLAMSDDDLDMVRQYFKSDLGGNRNPTLTEIRALDTYWSDHCRHTTFNTIIKSTDIKDERVKKAYDLFKSVNGERPETLMNIATAAMRYFRNRGELPMLDESDEINACTIKVGERYLFFKNETHNHPTEIEPFGGASTCIGGGIRDPLSGRAYVYQGMRITGSGDPLQPIKYTLPGKLPQRRLTQTAAEGFSSYANHIGAATGYIKEIYHPGYIAKRMEAGAVVAAADMSAVKRERPATGDIVLLIGARTGRDGVGGATGSSITHDVDTVTKASCEVQKGNPPEERRIQRLFRRPEATILIKKCNDFGAGGVSVAVGELADGLEINLDAVPLKYHGLNGTEIAISESQERMAIVIGKRDLDMFLSLCEEEAVEATVIAEVTDSNRLVMEWRGKKIVDIARDFLDTNGAKRYIDVCVPNADFEREVPKPELNSYSQKCLAERFDSSVGGLSVFMPYGGKYMQTECQVMAALIPSAGTEASVMAYGFDPYMTEADPFGGSIYAVVNSIAKIVAAGVDLDTVHLSFQEYFPRVDDKPERWGLPFAALLGAFTAQMDLKIAAIGGKDSMSGSFGDLDVPPTLISFAIGVGDAEQLVSPEFKAAGNPVYILRNTDDLPELRKLWEEYSVLIKEEKILSAAVCENSIKNCITNMSLGNMIGLDVGLDGINIPPASIIFEACEELYGYELLGYTSAIPIDIPKSPLESVFPSIKSSPIDCGYQSSVIPKTSCKSNVKCIIPVLPGTTGEYDAADALERAGGTSETILIRNLTPIMLQQSVAELENAISSAQMLVFPGGVESSGLIVSLFKNPQLTGAVHQLLNRNGLILGIGDGFKALLNLGLLSCDAELAPNSNGFHCHKYVSTVMETATSPWITECKKGEIYVQPISHSEYQVTGQVPDSQIAFKYTDGGIEAITSPDGRVFGKMAHFERYNEFTAKNIPGNKYLPLFEGAMKHFK